jgi:hypothetical protein
MTGPTTLHGRPQRAHRVRLHGRLGGRVAPRGAGRSRASRVKLAEMSRLGPVATGMVVTILVSSMGPVTAGCSSSCPPQRFHPATAEWTQTRTFEIGRREGADAGLESSLDGGTDSGCPTWCSYGHVSPCYKACRDVLTSPSSSCEDVCLNAAEYGPTDKVPAGFHATAGGSVVGCNFNATRSQVTCTFHQPAAGESCTCSLMDC